MYPDGSNRMMLNHVFFSVIFICELSIVFIYAGKMSSLFDSDPEENAKCDSLVIKEAKITTLHKTRIQGRLLTKRFF